MATAAADSDPGHRRDISPETHVRMSASRFASVVIGLLAGAFAFFGVYYSLREHTANTYIHLSPEFREKHGAPIGERDLELSKESTAQALDAIVKVHIDELAKQINAKAKR